MHAYTITHAIEDANVLRFHVDYFKPEGKNALKAGEALAKKAVIDAILAKHDTATASRRFNAVLATASINDAIEYHALFKAAQATKQAADPSFMPLNIACVFSPPAEGNADVQQIQEDLPQEKLDNQVDPDSKKAALKTILVDYNTRFGTAYNSDFSDRTFVEKRDMPSASEKGFKHSPLKLNQGLAVLETWNEETIKTRGAKLAEAGVMVWSAPKLSQDILDTYSHKPDVNTSYSIEDHPNLLTENMRLLFDAFRKAVLALDPCVSEEFLKLYVAFKAETNFVDVEPQARRLRLSLNMRFNEVDDPKGLCKDITDIGRWGNGDVEVGLSSMDQLPYVLGLVRQSLDLQLGNGAES